MSEQNNYRIVCDYKSSETEKWAGWRGGVVDMADTWQDAIHEWIDNVWAAEYTVVSENPSEDSKSGIIEIQFDPPQPFWLGAKIKATHIEN